MHTYNLACALADQPDTDVLLVVCDRGWLDLDILAKQPFATLVIPSDKFYDWREIARIIDSHGLDILQTYMVYFAAVVLGKASFQTHKPMCVEFHDIERTIAPIYLADKDEIAFHDSLQYQAGCVASLVRVMSRLDFKEVRDRWSDMAAKALWMPVSLRDPHIHPVDQAQRLNRLLFVGNTSYPPNAVAAECIVSRLAPLLPEAHLSLAGRGTESYSAPNVQAYGLVDRIEPLLATHSIGLAPIFEGSGMKIKLLDYLSAALPVLTTSIGACGYPKSPAIIVEDDLRQWPIMIRRLIRHPSKLQDLSAIARTLFLQHFDLNRSTRMLTKSYRQLRYAPTKVPCDFTDLAVDQQKIYWLKEIRETPRRPVTAPRLFRGARSC